MARNAKGMGSIRKKTVMRNGKPYTYYEARITTGRDPGTGKQIQRSFTAKTQREVLAKMQSTAVAVNEGVYTAPRRMTVGQWLDIWQRDYLGGVKPNTAQAYAGHIRNHIRPGLGAVRLVDLHPHTVQAFINGLELAPSSVQSVYQVLHTALEKAVRLDYISKNPAYSCELPRKDRKEIHPLDDWQAGTLLEAAKGHPLEHMLTVALFTGMRQSELLGLTWDAVDFDNGVISVNKQLARREHRKKHGLFASPKSGKSRAITAAPLVMRTLQAQRIRQAEMRLRAGIVWDNPHDLVFTDATGGLLDQRTVNRQFKQLADAAGLEEGTRFHDLRHTYAVNAIRAGDDIKTVQGNLGHATAAFTLDRYAHFTEAMKKDSAARMENFIKNTMGL